MEVRSKLNKCEIEVRPKWIRSESEVKSMWNRSEIDVRSKWHRSETEVESKWNRSEIEEKSKWTRTRIEVTSKWNRSEMKMTSETRMKLKRNRNDIGATLNRSETENPLPHKPPYQPLGWSYGIQTFGDFIESIFINFWSASSICHLFKISEFQSLQTLWFLAKCALY